MTPESLTPTLSQFTPDCGHTSPERTAASTKKHPVPLSSILLAGLAKNSIISYRSELEGSGKDLEGMRGIGAVEKRLQRILVDRKA